MRRRIAAAVLTILMSLGFAAGTTAISSSASADNTYCC